MVVRPEVELHGGALVISDLHLDVEREADVEGFCAWLGAHEGLPELLVLGDFFEYWIGRSQAQRPGARRLLAALKALTEAGTGLEVLHGNRDFLLGAAFEEATGARVHPAGFVGRLPGGERALFLHGDELATRDRAYQTLRFFLRSRPLLWLAHHLPNATVDALAQRLRTRSRESVPQKSALATELDAVACARMAAAASASTVVCGHVHRHRDEEVPGGPRWLVLDAFGEGQRDALQIGEDGGLLPVSSTAAGDYPDAAPHRAT